jgi:peptide/nickel transport system ATP-binding protein
VGNDTILSVKDLAISYKLDEETVHAVNGVSFDLQKGETLGLVGETGAGKTTIALGVMRLLPVPPAQVESGSIRFNDSDLLILSEKEMRKIRGRKISMVFQDPMTALNPVDTVGQQIAEVIKLHNKISDLEVKERAEKTLELVGIPKERYKDYPHQFSGGMKQRVVIAIALACSPDLLIADEPTTALDVTIQAQILRLINEIKQTKQTSIILITHDLGVVAQMCDKVAVIYGGEIVESGTTRQVFQKTRHPYTKGLFDSLPEINGSRSERLKPIKGLMPDPTKLPPGCKFAPRCPYATEDCTKGPIEGYYEEEDETKDHEGSDGHMVRCIHPLGGER